MHPSAALGRLRLRDTQRGFSLIELVVVISILGILIAIALPSFRNVRKDTQISQAKNALAVIVKECTVAAIRGQSTKLRDIPSARGALSGFVLSSQGLLGQNFLDSDCFKDVTINGQSKVQVSISAMADRPSQSDALRIFPVFAITYDRDSGSVSKTCLIGPLTQYTGGCSATYAPCTTDEFGNPVCPPSNGRGVW